MQSRLTTSTQRTVSLTLAAALTLTLAACGGASDAPPTDADVIATPLSILTQPADSQVVEGGEARFSISASGQGLNYQWQRSTDGGLTWQDIPGATSNTLALAGISSKDNGHLIRTMISNTGASTPSTAARLTVAAAIVAPSISIAPADTTTTAGGNASFSVTASGTNLAYQWQRSNDGKQWTNIAGQTLPTLTLSTVGVDSDGIQLRVTVSNSSGSMTSSAAQLKVQPASAIPSISNQPSAISVVAPAAATFTVVATGQPAPKYQWQRSTDGGASYVDIAGATSASFNTGPTSQANNGERFRVQVSNSIGSVLSQPQVLSVTAAQIAPTISLQPVDQRATAGQTVTFTSTVEGTPSPTLQWQVSQDGGNSWSNINGATGSSYGFIASASDNGRQYRLVVSNGRGSVTSRGALLSVTNTMSGLNGRAWTAMQRWLAPDPTATGVNQTLSSATLALLPKQSVIDRQGRVTTLVAQTDGSKTRLSAIRVDPGSGNAQIQIGNPVQIDSGAAFNQMVGVAMAVAPNGNVVAGWLNEAVCPTPTDVKRGTCTYLYIAKYLVGTGQWQAPIQMLETNSPDRTLAINDSGDVAALDFTLEGVTIAWRGASQTSTQKRSFDLMSLFLPEAIHLDNSGRFTAAGRMVQAASPGNTDIAVVRGSISSGVGPVEVVDQRGATAKFNGLFGNSAGQQVLMWSQDNGSRASQFAATLDTPTGTWKVSDLGVPPQTATPVLGALAEDGSFQWYLFNSLRCSTQRRVGGVWGAETSLPSALCDGAPQTVVSSNGDVLAVRTSSNTAGQWLTYDAKQGKLVHSPSAATVQSDFQFGLQGTLDGRLLLGPNGIGAFVSLNKYDVFPTPAAPNGDSRGLNSIWGQFLR